MACHGRPWWVPMGCLCGCRGHYKPRLVACHGQPMWVPWHAHGHHKPRLVWRAVACPWAPQTEVSGMPWPALVCALACLGGVPRHATAGLGGRVPCHARGHYKTEVSGMPWPAFGGAVACHGGCQGTPWLALGVRPRWVPWHALVGAMGLPRHAVACLAGCHGLPCWVPWGCQGMP